MKIIELLEMIHIPLGRKGKATAPAPSILYHNMRKRTLGRDGEITGYNLSPKEQELADMFMEPSTDGYVWLSADPTYSGVGSIAIDARKLDPNNLRYTGQSEGFILHRGSIPKEAIIK